MILHIPPWPPWGTSWDPGPRVPPGGAEGAAADWEFACAEPRIHCLFENNETTYPPRKPGIPLHFPEFTASTTFDSSESPPMRHQKSQSAAAPSAPPPPLCFAERGCVNRGDKQWPIARAVYPHRMLGLFGNTGNLGRQSEPTVYLKIQGTVGESGDL